MNILTNMQIWVGDSLDCNHGKHNFISNGDATLLQKDPRENLPLTMLKFINVGNALL